MPTASVEHPRVRASRVHRACSDRGQLKEKFNPRSEARAIREFLPWAQDQNVLARAYADTVRRVLDMFESRTKGELATVESALDSLRKETALQVFPLIEATLSRALELARGTT